MFKAVDGRHGGGTFGFLLLRVKQKYVRTRKCSYLVEVIDNACFDGVRVIINNQVRVNVNNCTSLDEKLAQPASPHNHSKRDVTSAIGVSFRILARIL